MRFFVLWLLYLLWIFSIGCHFANSKNQVKLSDFRPEWRIGDKWDVEYTVTPFSILPGIPWGYVTHIATYQVMSEEIVDGEMCFVVHVSSVKISDCGRSGVDHSISPDQGTHYFRKSDMMIMKYNGSPLYGILQRHSLDEALMYDQGTGKEILIDWPKFDNRLLRPGSTEQWIFNNYSTQRAHLITYVMAETKLEQFSASSSGRVTKQVWEIGKPWWIRAEKVYTGCEYEGITAKLVGRLIE